MPAQDCLHSRLELIYSLVDVLDLRAFLSGWFKGVPFEELRSENVKDFFAFGLWYASNRAVCRLAPVPINPAVCGRAPVPISQATSLRLRLIAFSLPAKSMLS